MAEAKLKLKSNNSIFISNLLKLFWSSAGEGNLVFIIYFASIQLLPLAEAAGISLIFKVLLQNLAFSLFSRPCVNKDMVYVFIFLVQGKPCKVF